MMAMADSLDSRVNPDDVYLLAWCADSRKTWLYYRRQRNMTKAIIEKAFARDSIMPMTNWVTSELPRSF